MMRGAERKLEKKRKKKGGSNEGKIGWNEDKKICPFDDKKVCPVTTLKNNLSPRRNPRGFLFKVLFIGQIM